MPLIYQVKCSKQYAGAERGLRQGRVSFYQRENVDILLVIARNEAIQKFLRTGLPRRFAPRNDGLKY
jgi:hypothetical protein